MYHKRTLLLMLYFLHSSGKWQLKGIYFCFPDSLFLHYQICFVFDFVHPISKITISSTPFLCHLVGGQKMGTNLCVKRISLMQLKQVDCLVCQLRNFDLSIKEQSWSGYSIKY